MGVRGKNVAQYESQQDEPIMMDKVRGSVVDPRDPRAGGLNNKSELLHVQPYQKKYLQGVPGSSPVIRPADDLNFQQKYGKGPLIERAERLKRLQELKNNIHVRASERGESDDGIIRIIRDDRVKRVGIDDPGVRRTPSSNMDIIHKHKESDVAILYNDVDD